MRDERLERRDTERCKHRPRIDGAGADVASRKSVTIAFSSADQLGVAVGIHQPVELRLV